ncbi:hypothetical protein IL306_011204 [Fusarium sp. DS 682]|nr:hypothetical protein IL306_011204 [Fusarium sp. DS 682]
MAPTSHETVSSTITADVTETTDAFETTLTEGATDDLETIITESATDTITTGSITTFLTVTTTEVSPEQSATTTAGSEGPETCVEEQILYSPSFDDEDSVNAWPWDLGNGVSVSSDQPMSYPNCLQVPPSSDDISQTNHFLNRHSTLNGPSTVTFSQSLPILGPYTYQLEYYISMKSATGNNGLACSAVPKINDQVLTPSQTFTGRSLGGYDYSSQYFTAADQNSPAELIIDVTCTGDFGQVVITMDDFPLARRCAT